MLNFSISKGMEFYIPAQYAAMLGINRDKEATITRKNLERFALFSEKTMGLIQPLDKQLCEKSAKMQQKTIGQKGYNKNYHVSQMLPKMIVLTGISDFFEKYIPILKYKSQFVSNQDAFERSFRILFRNLNRAETNEYFPEIYSLLTQIHDLFSEYISEASEEEEDLFDANSFSSEYSRSSTPPINIIYPPITFVKETKATPGHDNFEQYLKREKTSESR